MPPRCSSWLDRGQGPGATRAGAVLAQRGRAPGDAQYELGGHWCELGRLSGSTGCDLGTGRVSWGHWCARQATVGIQCWARAWWCGDIRGEQGAADGSLGRGWEGCLEQRHKGSVVAAAWVAPWWPRPQAGSMWSCQLFSVHSGQPTLCPQHCPVPLPAPQPPLPRSRPSCPPTAAPVPRSPCPGSHGAGCCGTAGSRVFRAPDPSPQPAFISG